MSCELAPPPSLTLTNEASPPAQFTSFGVDWREKSTAAALSGSAAAADGRRRQEKEKEEEGEEKEEEEEARGVESLTAHLTTERRVEASLWFHRFVSFSAPP